NTLDAYLSAYQSDPISAFGGIIAFNYPIDPITAQTILNKQFLEVLITPPITKKTLNIIKLKQNIRVLIINKYKYKNKELHFKYIHGGLLLQDPDIMDTNSTQWKVVTHRKPSELELKDSIFCWKVVKFVKSNAIVYCKNLSTIAIGAGQTSRIASTIIANMKLKEKKQEIFGCTLASDAFLPFKDNIHQASKLGITCIIQPGGSIRDHETIQAANKHDISMIFTFIRHFKH
ncbi:bifunctional phosphoribosylaminoimidazolecarboxamide formyltransferase/IMP cyclohydrolase, partial [Buchnera aphidicola (Hormaphis cornu)]